MGVAIMEIVKLNVVLTVRHSISAQRNQNDALLIDLFRTKCLYLFRALLAQPREVLHKQHLVCCVRVMSDGCTRICVQRHALFIQCIKN
jgi:hypothetical protein